MHKGLARHLPETSVACTLRALAHPLSHLEPKPHPVLFNAVCPCGTDMFLTLPFTPFSEIQRTLMELLNQLDGFDALGQVKMIMATNRPDVLGVLA